MSDDLKRKNISSLSLQDFTVNRHQRRDLIISAKLITGEVGHEISGLHPRVPGWQARNNPNESSNSHSSI